MAHMLADVMVSKTEIVRAVDSESKRAFLMDGLLETRLAEPMDERSAFWKDGLLAA